VRHAPLLELGRERQRREARADALDRRVQVVEGAVLDHGGELGAVATARDRLVGGDGAGRLLHGLDDRLLVERLQRARIDHLDGDAVLLGVLGRLQRLVHEPADGDHGHVGALAQDARLAERDLLDLLRHLALERVQEPVLEEDDRVRVVDRRQQQAADVLGRGRVDDLQSGHVDEPRLELLRVLRARRPAGAALRADRQRHLQLPTAHRPVLRRLVDELLHREREEVLVHDLDDRVHALHGGADPRADDRHLGDRRVAHALRAELGEHALGHAHGAAHLGDVLAHHEHRVVAAHRLRERAADRLAVGQLRHRPT
jgi:hypothetical protein